MRALHHTCPVTRRRRGGGADGEHTSSWWRRGGWRGKDGGRRRAGGGGGRRPPGRRPRGAGVPGSGSTARGLPPPLPVGTGTGTRGPRDGCDGGAGGQARRTSYFSRLNTVIGRGLVGRHVILPASKVARPGPRPEETPPPAMGRPWAPAAPPVGSARGGPVAPAPPPPPPSGGAPPLSHGAGRTGG